MIVNKTYVKALEGVVAMIEEKGREIIVSCIFVSILYSVRLQNSRNKALFRLQIQKRFYNSYL